MQRLTVTATDAVLMGAAAYALDPAVIRLSPGRSRLAFALVVAHAGLLLVDHIHFQYNGMLLGASPCRELTADLGAPSGCTRAVRTLLTGPVNDLGCHAVLASYRSVHAASARRFAVVLAARKGRVLCCKMISTRPTPIWLLHLASAAAGLFLLSVALIGRGRDLAGGVVFAVLLNMKHLFACAAPVYFVYLLRHHCRWAPSRTLRRVSRLCGHCPALGDKVTAPCSFGKTCCVVPPFPGLWQTRAALPRDCYQTAAHRRG